MFQTLYDLAVSIIGVVPVGLEIIYVFATLFLFFLVLLPFIYAFKIVFDLFD